MSDIRVQAQQLNVLRVPDSQLIALRGLRDGAAIVCPWFQALALEGRVFQANGPEVLTLAFTGMTLLALASHADTSATLNVDVPDGTACLPLGAYFNFAATGAAIVAAIGFLSDTLAGTAGTETSTSIRNYHRGTPVASAGTAFHTADTEADHISGAEVILFRYHTTFDIDAAVGYNERNLWQPATEFGVVPVGVDGVSFSVDMAPTTSGTGFAQITWAELPEAAVA